MIESFDGFGPFNLAIFVQVRHGGSLSDNVMVGFEGELDLLLALMEIKDEVELGQRMDSMGRGSELWILDQRQIGDWFSTP